MKEGKPKWHHKMLVIGFILLIVVLVFVSGDETDMCKLDECKESAYCTSLCVNENLSNVKEDFYANIP